MDIVDLDPTIRREYDIRGIVGHNFTPKVAMSLARAFGMEVIRVFGKSKVLRAGLGEELVSSYAKLKHLEWRSYAAAISPWERDHTLDC